MHYCSRCKDYRLNDTNTCRCKLFMITGQDGDNYKIYALDDESAALKHAEESKAKRNYYLIEGCVEIKVNDKPFIISAEPDIHYSAYEVDI